MGAIFGKGGIIDEVGRAIDPRAGMRAAEEAASTQAAYQQEALDYLKQTEQLPLELRDQALTALSQFYGGDQQGMIDQAMQSPFYQSMLQQGQDAVLRNAAATGGLRSGNVQQALATQSQDVLNQVLGQRLSGLSSLAQLPMNTNAIAQQTSNIGQTYAQGMIGGAQSLQSGVGQLLNAGALAFSDVRLKSNIELIGNESGHNIYKWQWNDKAEELGLIGEGIGVMAHEMDDKALMVDNDTGYLVVDYAEVFNG